jgi:hypothetical protein
MPTLNVVGQELAPAQDEHGSLQTRFDLSGETSCSTSRRELALGATARQRLTVLEQLKIMAVILQAKGEASAAAVVARLQEELRAVSCAFYASACLGAW